jgi:tRNA pseudouridine55 synthase
MRRSSAKGRDVHGVLLLDKPRGLSSNQALQRVKRLFNARKAGHTGSLDPLATGLLPICLGEATKLSSYLLDADKHYQAEAQLGVVTDTGDAEGEVIERHAVPALDEARIEAALAGFRGEIEQIPPMHSAIKHQGRRLYELARKGEVVERQPRRVTILALELLSRTDDRLMLDVRCSKGTYIRTLVEDLGRALGCGAHVSLLRRVGVAPYDAPRMYTLAELADLAEAGELDSALIPMQSALAHWPSLRLDQALETELRQGRRIRNPDAPEAGLLCLLGPGERFLGIGRALGGGWVAPQRLMSHRV